MLHTLEFQIFSPFMWSEKTRAWYPTYKTLCPPRNVRGGEDSKKQISNQQSGEGGEKPVFDTPKVAAAKTENT